MQTENLFLSPIGEYSSSTSIFPCFNKFESITENLERIMGGDSFVKLTAHLQVQQQNVVDSLALNDPNKLLEFECNQSLISLLYALRELDAYSVIQKNSALVNELFSDKDQGGKPETT